MMFLTERAVFRMTDQGMEISEVAPGIVIENDILPYVPFPIGVSQSVRSMDRRIFFDTPMGIRDEILTRTK